MKSLLHETARAATWDLDAREFWCFGAWIFTGGILICREYCPTEETIMGQRPVSVTIFGILNIGLAVFGMMSLALSRIIMTVANLPGNNIFKSLNNNPVYLAWMKVSMLMGLISYPVLLIAGIALLLLKSWGRITSIAYAIYAIIWALIGACMAIVIFKAGSHQSLDRFGGMGVAIALVGAVISLVFSLAYPVLLLIFMTRPNVVAAFRPAQPINQSAIPGPPRSAG